MNHPRRLLNVFVLIVAACAARAADSPITHVAGDDIIAWIAIPNLPEALKHSEAAAETFAGRPVPIIDQVANHFGDPGLAQIRADAPTVIFIVPSKVTIGSPLYVGCVPVKDGAMYQAMAEAVHQKTTLIDNVLVLSQSDEGTGRGQDLMAAYQDIAKAGIAHDARIYASMSKVMATWGPMLRMGVTTLASMAAMQGKPGQDPMLISNILTLECNLCLELLDQSDELQLDLTWDADKLEQRLDFAAKPGSDLAALLTAPAATTNAALPLLGEQPGSIACAMRFNADGLRTLVSGLLTKLSADPATKTLVEPAIAPIMDFIGGMTGEGASSVSFVADGGGLACANAITGKDAGVKYLDAMQALLVDGSFGKLYEGMGLKADLKRSVRNHAGVDVHHFALDASGATDKPEELAMMTSMGNQLIAITDRWILTAGNDAALDAMIDRVNSGAVTPAFTLKSQQKYGSAAHFYMDYDIAGLIRQMMALAMPATAPQDAQAEPDPVLMAMTFAQGSSSTEVSIPFKPIADFVKSMEQQRRERRQQRRQAAQQQQQQEAPAEENAAPEPDVTF